MNNENLPKSFDLTLMGVAAVLVVFCLVTAITVPIGQDMTASRSIIYFVGSISIAIASGAAFVGALHNYRYGRSEPNRVFDIEQMD